MHSEAKALLAEFRAVPPVDEEISPNDTMYEGNLDHYLESGRSALRCVRLAMLATGIAGFENILDLPSGWGRCLRTFVAAFPDARVTACDLERDAVEFCASRFGAVPVYSSEEPSEVELEPGFDLIWCGSLLTHLPSPKWNAFLDLFESVLAPGGLLIFTTCGPYVAEDIRRKRSEMSPDDQRLIYGIRGKRVRPLLRAYERRGFGYEDYKYRPGYGTAVASPAWVCDLLAKRPQLLLKCYLERGWHNHQDVFACVRT